MSLSSSETDNITLDSGIYFDSNSDLIKQSVPLNVISKEPPATLHPPHPPPPPYNSYHKVIYGILDSTNANMSFHCENSNNSISNNFNSGGQCSTYDLFVNQNFQNHLSRSNNRLSLSLLTEERKQSKSAFNNFCQLNKVIESSSNQGNQQNHELSQTQQPDSMYQNNQLINKFSKNFHLTKRSQYLNQFIKESIEDTKILGTCNKCQYLVTDSESACIALGNLYHSNCFTCCYCNRSLQGKVFYKDQDKIYCENDYMVFGFHKSVKICCACGHIVTETILEALGKDFHPRCFKCIICQKCLDGIPFTIDRNNNIYCILDYHNTFAPKCTVCLKPIIPRKDSDEIVRIIVNDRDFHIECYKCQSCLRMLSNESNCFVWVTDRSKANIKLLCRKCCQSNTRKTNVSFLCVLDDLTDN